MALTDADEIKGASRLRRAYNATKGVAGAVAKPFTAAAGALRAAGPGISAVSPTAVGGAGMAAVNVARQQQADAAPAFVPPANQNAPGQIPVDPTLRAPAPIAGQFFNQNEVLRNIGNTLNALTGGKMAGAAKVLGGMEALPAASTFVASGAGRAARALGAESSAANNVALAAKNATQTAADAAVAANATKTATAAKGLLAGAQGAALADTTGAGVTPSGSAPNTTTPNQASYSNEGNNYNTPEKVQTLRPPPFDPAGKIIKTVGKDGKVSYSGDNVKFGGDIYSPDGRVVNGGDPKNPKGFGVTSLDTSEGLRQDKMELQRLQGERAEREAGFAGNQPGGGLGGFGGATLSNSLRDKTDSGRGVTMSDLIAQKRALKQDTINAQREGNAMQAATAMQTAAMNNATLRENNANTARVNLRGHELDFERGMAPIRFQQQQRAQIADLLKSTNGDPAAAAQQALAAGRVDLAETLSKPVATMQGEAEKRDGLIENKRKEIAAGVKGAFNHMDKDGQPKMSEALEAQAIARFMRANPNFHQEGDPAKRQKMIDDALGDEELMARFSKPTSGGYGSITPNLLTGNKPMLRQDNIPNDELLARGQIGEPIGGLRNLLSPNTSKGDRFFDPGDGYEAVNMGDLSARALARLEKHRKEAAERLRK